MHGKKRRKHDSSRGVADCPVPVPTMRQIQKEIRSLVRREESSKKGKNQSQTQIPRKAVQPMGRPTSWKEKHLLEREKLIQLGGREPKGQKRTLATHLQMTKKEKERKRKQQHLKDGLLGGDSWEASHAVITPTRRIGSRRKPGKREPGSREGHCSGKHAQQEAFSMLHQSPIRSPGEGRDDTSPTAHSKKGKKRKRSRGKKKEKRNTP